jgi:ribonuclease-3
MKLTLGAQFKNQQLLETALTHRSYLNEHRSQKLESNERLEFLGDAVLELIVSLYLFEKYPTFPEGRLTAKRAQLVQTKTLAMASQNLQIGSQLRLSRGEKASGGQQNPSILADTFEALIGAVYQDTGFQKAFDFVKQNLLIPAEKMFKEQLPQDFKSQLQELVQAQGYASPTYKVLESFGPDHSKTFQVAVLINEKPAAEARGRSKQEAEQLTAQKALAKLTRK